MLESAMARGRLHSGESNHSTSPEDMLVRCVVSFQHNRNTDLCFLFITAMPNT